MGLEACQGISLLRGLEFLIEEMRKPDDIGVPQNQGNASSGGTRDNCWAGHSVTLSHPGMLFPLL